MYVHTDKRCGMYLIPRGPDDGQDVQEQIDYVHVQVEGGEDVLLGGNGVFVIPSHHHLGVVHDVNGEYQSAEGRVHHDHGLAGEDHTDDTEHHQNNNGHKQNASHCSEVDFGLEGEHRESHSDNECNQGCVEHLFLFVQGGSAAQKEALSQCEDAKANEVHRSLTTCLATAGQHYQGYEHGDECKPP